MDCTILVAGEEEQVAKVAACLVDRYRVVVAGDTQSLLHMLEQNRVDLVVLGLYLEGRGAWEIIPMISRARPQMRIVTVAQENTLEKEIAVREQGVFYYLVEPFEAEEMTWVVKEVLGEQEALHSVEESISSSGKKSADFSP